MIVKDDLEPLINATCGLWLLVVVCIKACPNAAHSLFYLAFCQTLLAVMLLLLLMLSYSME